MGFRTRVLDKLDILLGYGFRAGMTADIASAHSFTLVGLKNIGIEIILADAHLQYCKSR